MRYRLILLQVACAMPSTYLLVLLLFDAKSMASGHGDLVGRFPFPVYLKAALALINLFTVAALLRSASGNTRPANPSSPAITDSAVPGSRSLLD